MMFCVLGIWLPAPALPLRLFGLLQPLALAEADTGATAVLGDKFDARVFKCLPKCQIISCRQ